MKLDVNTLFLVTIYVEAILGLLLLFAWVQNASIRAVAWWGFAHLVRAGSVMLFGMYGTVSDLVSIDLANVLLFTAFALTWTGARVFDGKAPHPLGLVAGGALWLLVCRMPAVSGAWDVRFLISSGIITGYTWLTAYEFWCGRGEPLVSRWPAIFMLFAHGSLFLLRTPIAAVLPWTAAATANQVAESVWLTVLSFEALLFTIAIAFILLAMAKERTEHRHKTAALIDPLTGLANRRAFLQEATDRVRRAAAEGSSGAVFLIDLDHFKSINDRFGHAVGDRVLEIFAETARAVLRPNDIVGRLGGEEFAAAAPGIEREAAFILAERLRTAFAAAVVDVDGLAVGATVSMGVAMTTDAPAELPALLAAADQALYCAKERGRNRVEMVSLELLASRARRVQGEMRAAASAISAA